MTNEPLTGDPGPIPDDVNDHDIALLTGEELLTLIASALIRQQQEVIELRDAVAAAMRANRFLSDEVDRLVADLDDARRGL